MPFVKLDTRILDSTLWIKRDLREVFITALLMAEPMEFDEPQRQIEVDSLDHTDFEAPPGWYGFVPAASFGIINRAGVDMEAGMVAIRKLGQPEIESRSPEFEGRRMIRINGGFLILNYMKYRDKDYTAKDRMARLRARRKEGKVTRNSNGVHPNVTQAESRVQRAEAEGERPPAHRITEEACYDADDDPEENIPDGMPILQYAQFVLERAHVPAGYMLKVHAGDALGMLAKEEACSLALATKRMLDRMRAAEKQGPVKWNFWLQDGGWKQRVEAGISTEGWERETD